LRTWIDWYRFARRELEYPRSEAAASADVRTVEDQNRQSAVPRRGA
jgi:hypothetical protein